MGSFSSKLMVLYVIYFISMDLWAGITILPFLWLGYQSSWFYAEYVKGIFWSIKLQIFIMGFYWLALQVLSEKVIFEALIRVFIDLLIIWKYILNHLTN